MLHRLKSFLMASALRLNIGMTLGQQFVAVVVQLLVVVLISRNLGPEGNGFYTMAVLLPTMLANFLNLGIGPATIYFVSRRKFSAKQAALENTKLALAIACAGIAIAVPVLLIYGERLFPGIPTSLLLFGLAGFPLTLYLGFSSSVLQGIEDFRAFNASILLPPAVSIVVVPFTFYILELGIYGVLSAYILGQLAASIAVFMFLKKHFASDVTANSDNSVASITYYKSVVRYGGKAHLSNVITFINYRADIFLVNIFLDPATVGIYALAVQIAEKLWMPSQAASTVLFPKLSSMGDRPVERLKLTNKVFLLVAAITTILGSLTAAMLHIFITPIFGKEYLSVFPTLYWLLPGIIFWAGARIQSNCIAAAGKPEWNMHLSLAVLIINLIGNILLIPRYGVVGAALATSIAYIFDAMIKLFLVGLTGRTDSLKGSVHG